MERLNILDKGYVQYIRHMGTDLSPVEDARMSTGNATGVDKTKDDKLRRRLWKDQHISPFEGCVLCVEIKLPLFVLRQIERHRTLDIEDIEISEADEFRKFTSRNEFSGRYAEFKDEFYVPDVDRFGLIDPNNKQAMPRDMEITLIYKEVDMGKIIQDHSINSYKEYESLLSKGAPKELARLVLPGNIYTKIRITANMLNWFKFLKLRLDKHAQYEVRVYAEAIATIIKELWPECYRLFEESLNTVHVDFSYAELETIKATMEHTFKNVDIDSDIGKLLLKIRKMKPI